MKKLKASLCALGITAGLISGVSAETQHLDDLGPVNPQTVQGMSTTDTVYSIDIYWGNLRYTYSGATWDPATHSLVWLRRHLGNQ